MKQSTGATKSDYKTKYYELRRTAKELMFENNSYQAEIEECQKMIAQRERERELLLQHLLQYEQEAWELQSEMSNAYNEKHKLLKKQQEADKRKRVKLDSNLAETTTSIPSEPEGSLPKIPKIKIVFQHKGPPVSAPVQEPVTKVQGPVLDINTETKTAIKNKLKRNKIDPIVISLPTMLQNKDPLTQQTVKRPRPTNLGLNMPLNNLISSSVASGLMLSPSMLGVSSSNSLANQLSCSSSSALGMSSGGSHGLDLSDFLAHVPTSSTSIDVFSDSETPISMISPSISCFPDRSMTREDVFKAIRSQVPVIDDDTDPVSMLTAMKRSGDTGFRISSSALKNIKQKIDSINANFDQSVLKAAAKAMMSPNLPHNLDVVKKENQDDDKT